VAVVGETAATMTPTHAAAAVEAAFTLTAELPDCVAPGDAATTMTTTTVTLTPSRPSWWRHTEEE
jgi:hypothetical protein